MLRDRLRIFVHLRNPVTLCFLAGWLVSQLAPPTSVASAAELLSVEISGGANAYAQRAIPGVVVDDENHASVERPGKLFGADFATVATSATASESWSTTATSISVAHWGVGTNQIDQGNFYSSGYAAVQAPYGTSVYVGGGGRADSSIRATSQFTLDEPATLWLLASGDIEDSNGGIIRLDGSLIFNPGAFNATGIMDSYLLEAGSHTIEIESPRAGAALGYFDPNRMIEVQTAFSAIWSLNGQPGSTPEQALFPTQVIQNANGALPSWEFNIPLLSPAPVFVDPAFATGYDYSVEGTTFATVLIPAPLPLGDSQFDLIVNNQIYSLEAGTAFDLTSIAQGGVSSFSIRGIDPNEMLDPNNSQAFVTGLTFTSLGMANVTMSPVPEPSTLCLAGVGAIGLLVRKLRRLRGKSSPPSGGDPQLG